MSNDPNVRSFNCGLQNTAAVTSHICMKCPEKHGILHLKFKMFTPAVKYDAAYFTRFIES